MENSDPRPIGTLFPADVERVFLDDLIRTVAFLYPEKNLRPLPIGAAQEDIVVLIGAVVSVAYRVWVTSKKVRTKIEAGDPAGAIEELRVMCGGLHEMAMIALDSSLAIGAAGSASGQPPTPFTRMPDDGQTH